jgi:hypothetical protein
VADNAPLPELTLTIDNKTIQVYSCKEFISSIKGRNANVEETTFNMQIFAEYQPCIASSIIQQAKPTDKTFLNGSFADLIINYLDLSSFPSSLGPRLEDDKQKLNAFQFKDIKTTDHEVKISDNGWVYEFTLLAKGDFNSDGIGDLLIRFLDQADEGSYFSLQTLILERRSSDSKIKANNAVEVLKEN